MRTAIVGVAFRMGMGHYIEIKLFYMEDCFTDGRVRARFKFKYGSSSRTTNGSAYITVAPRTH